MHFGGGGFSAGVFFWLVGFLGFWWGFFLLGKDNVKTIITSP